jgi:hypothetical protein
VRTFNLIWTILFILFAALQLNDPDPWIWIPLYLLAAALCGFRFAGKGISGLERTAIIVYIIYAVLLLFIQNGVVDWYEKHEAENLVQSMKATKPWIENTREFGGLLIMILILSINLFNGRKNKDAV